MKAITKVKTGTHSEDIANNCTIRLGYANAKIYKCDTCPRPKCYKSYGSEKEDSPDCDTVGCNGKLELLRHGKKKKKLKK